MSEQRAVRFRAAVLDIVREVVADLGDPIVWEPIGVRWTPASPPPDPSLAPMDFEVTSLYDPDNEALELLRRSRSSITVELIDPRSHSRYEVHLPVSWPADVALATLAEQLQDHAVESTEGYGRALPPCPIHPVHPLSPLPIDGIAVWRCPATRKVIGPVGRLSSGGSGSDSASP